MSKRQLTPDELDRVLTACGVDPALVVTRDEVTEGSYNAAYRVRTADAGYILKVAPDPAVPAMTYERDIMHTEARFYQAAAETVPVPRVAHTGFERRLLETDFLLMTEVPGSPWFGQKLDKAMRTKLRGELGAIVAAQHRITGTGFGYPQLGLKATWREAFRSMIDAVLEDADRYGVQLPVPAEEISSLLDSEAFDEITRPALVHFDLWDGNILLDGARIAGLIDGERAFWGDPLAEMASLALFADIQQDAAFLAGYSAGGGELRFDGTAQFRLAAYRAYLYLIMLIETVPRGRTGPENEPMARLVTRHLVDNIGALSTQEPVR